MDFQHKSGPSDGPMRCVIALCTLDGDLLGSSRIVFTTVTSQGGPRTDQSRWASGIKGRMGVLVLTR